MNANSIIRLCTYADNPDKTNSRVRLVRPTLRRIEARLRQLKRAERVALKMNLLSPTRGAILASVKGERSKFNAYLGTLQVPFVQALANPEHNSFLAAALAA